MKLTARIKYAPKLTANFKELKMPLSGGFEEGYNQGYADGQGTALDGILNKTIEEVKSESATSASQYLFQNCKELTTVELPNAITLADGAFSGCSALKVADFPQVTSIGNYCFRGCTSLERAIFPKLTDLKNYGFYGARNLSYFYAPVATRLQDRCFESCLMLEKLDLPSVTSITGYACINAKSLVCVILRFNTVATLQYTQAFSKTPIESGTGYVYVPKNLVEQYKAAANWSTYVSQIRAIEDYPEITGG